jgi:hypothetical protein
MTTVLHYQGAHDYQGVALLLILLVDTLRVSAGSHGGQAGLVLTLHGFPDNAASFFAQTTAFTEAGRFI